MSGVADAPGTRSGVRDGPTRAAASPRGPSGTTTYRVERPRRAGPVAIAAKAVVAVVFAATVALCAYRAAVPRATPHDHVPAVVLTGGFAATAIVACVLTVAAMFWVVRGARFADTLVFAIVWPIATVLMVIVAGASAVPQHYLRTGLVLVPAGVAAVGMMTAVAWVYNRSATR